MLFDMKHSEISRPHLERYKIKRYKKKLNHLIMTRRAPDAMVLNDSLASTTMMHPYMVPIYAWTDNGLSFTIVVVIATGACPFLSIILVTVGLVHISHSGS